MAETEKRMPIRLSNDEARMVADGLAAREKEIPKESPETGVQAFYISALRDLRERVEERYGLKPAPDETESEPATP